MSLIQESNGFFWDVRMIISSVIFVVVFFQIFKWLKSFTRMFMIARKLPGPEGHFLLGNYLTHPREPRELYRLFKTLGTQYGSVVRFWLGPDLMVWLMDPEDVKFALGSFKVNHRPWFLSKGMMAHIGTGLLTMADDKHYRNHRRLVNQVFHPSMLKGFHSVFEEMARNLTARLSEVADGRTIDIKNSIWLSTTEAVCTTIVGHNTSDMPGFVEEIMALFKDGEDLMPRSMFEPWLTFPIVSQIFQAGRKLKADQKTREALIERLVSEKRKALNEGRSTRREGGGEEGKTTKGVSMLDMGLQDAALLEEMKEGINSLLSAGSVTTAALVSFMMVLLGIHQEVQEEVSRELEEVFGSDPRTPTEEDISRLEKLHRVIKEALRLFPTVPLTGREVLDDIHLPSGAVLPAGCTMTVSFFLVHRDPKSFQDPDNFIPDRWLPGNPQLLNAKAFMPFGVGGRQCIGSKYAMTQMKIVSTHLLRKFKVTTSCTMEDLSDLRASASLWVDSFPIQLHKKHYKTFAQ